MKPLILEPSNQKIIAFTDITKDGSRKYVVLDDVMQITFSSPVDTKPILQLGVGEQLGYTYGARMYAGTMQLPANSYPSIFRLFSDWIEYVMDVIGFEGMPTVNQEDLPPFDMAIISVPEDNDQDTQLFAYVFNNVKFIETTVELTVQSPDRQVMFYRFTQNYIGQKLLIPRKSQLNINLTVDEIVNVLDMRKYDPFLKNVLNDRQVIAESYTQAIAERLQR